MIEIAFVSLIALGVGGLFYFSLSRSSFVNAAPRVEEKGGVRTAILPSLPDKNVLIVLFAVLLTVTLWLIAAHPLVCFLAAVGGVVIPNKIYGYLRKKRAAVIDSQVPDILSMMSGAMRSGASLMVSLESVAKDGPRPIKHEVDMMLREVRLGIDLDNALDHLAVRVQSSEMIMVAAAIKIARESGGNLSESLENLSRTVRDRQNMEKKILALTAQGRMQALVMAGLPFFMLYMLFQLDPVAMSPMFHSMLGWIIFILVCVWITIGFKAIEKIMSIDI
ncbi:membrane protein [Betaproteobacteria bacterium]|nr:membrane protein [Betaproteobacteria bacterium]GHU14662.1 membrane protein [Betaproteobacteria bacterium]